MMLNDIGVFPYDLLKNICGLFDYACVGDNIDDAFEPCAGALYHFKSEHQAAQRFTAACGHIENADITAFVKI